MAPVRGMVPLGLLVAFVLMLPALGIALVKPAVVGTTARASNENVRSIGYSIYYTLVNIGGAAGPYVASYVHRNMSVENVFRVAAISVLIVSALALGPRPRGAPRALSTGLILESKVFVALTQADIRQTAEHHLAHASAGRVGSEIFPVE